MLRNITILSVLLMHGSVAPVVRLSIRQYWPIVPAVIMFSSVKENISAKKPGAKVPGFSLLVYNPNIR